MRGEMRKGCTSICTQVSDWTSGVVQSCLQSIHLYTYMYSLYVVYNVLCIMYVFIICSRVQCCISSVPRVYRMSCLHIVWTPHCVSATVSCIYKHIKHYFLLCCVFIARKAILVSCAMSFGNINDRASASDRIRRGNFAMQNMFFRSARRDRLHRS